jgi:protein TonB
MTAPRLVTGVIVLAFHAALLVWVWQMEPVRRAVERVVRVEIVPVAASRPRPPPEPPKLPRTTRQDPVPTPMMRDVFDPPPILIPNPSPQALVLSVPLEPALVVAEAPPAVGLPYAPAAPPVVAPPVTPPRFDAAYLDNPAPTYPVLSKRRGEQGRVLLRVLVAADGTAERVELAKSSGAERLDHAALETVRRWRFVPAKAGAAPVAAWVYVPIAFTLQS